MPVFNTNPHYIKEAIESIIVTQTYKGPIMLCLIDDGSTNMRTVQYLESARQTYSAKLIVYTLPENRGLPEALNTGMQIAFDM